MAKYLGPGWLKLDKEISGDFFAVIKGTQENSKYYDIFSSMNPNELKDAANYIGLHGNADKFLPVSKTGPTEADLKEPEERSGNTTAMIIIMSAAAACLAAFAILRKKYRQIHN